jgi:hypothetical protein
MHRKRLFVSYWYCFWFLFTNKSREKFEEKMAIFVFKGVKIVIYTVCLFQILFYSSADLQQGYFAQFGVVLCR